jgi:HupE / UreJ protein
LSLAPPLLAHDIPADATVRVFVKPDSNRLRLLLRLPMASIQEIDWPVHKSDGTLDLAAIDPFLRQAANKWIGDKISFYEESSQIDTHSLIAAQLSLEGDTSFGTYENAVSHVTGPPLASNTKLLPTQGVLDAMFEYPIRSDRSRFSFRPQFQQFGLRVITVLRFLPPDGAIRAYEYEGGDPGVIRLDPTWHQAAWTFVTMGFRHILDGADHLLFLFCLVIPLRSLRRLIPVVTAFTVAHSITLIASAYDMAPGVPWFPPLIETLIAASIVYMALENIVVLTPSRRWMITFGFGLVHGFGFSFALRKTLQFAGSHLLTSLLSFNIGVELGQVFMLVLMVPALKLLFRYVVAERVGTIILSALATHTAWHWMTERYEQLSKFPITLPAFDAAFIATALRWAIVVVAFAGVMWLLSLVRQSRRRRDEISAE